MGQITRIPYMKANRSFTVTINEYKDKKICGMIFYPGMPKAEEYESLIHMAGIMEETMNQMNSPMNSMTHRSFTDGEKHTFGIYERADLTENQSKVHIHPGNLATLEIRVYYRFYATWQGEILWINTLEHIRFDSFLEMTKIIADIVYAEKSEDLEPYAPGVCKVAVDRYDDYEISGSLAHSRAKRKLQVGSTIELMLQLESLLEKTAGLPAESSRQMICYQTLDAYRGSGRRATFLIRLLFQENHTWQGIITWVDNQKSLEFRSFLEMVLLMDGVLNDQNMVTGKNSEEKIS